jgi:hypothetical protein
MGSDHRHPFPAVYQHWQRQVMGTPFDCEDSLERSFVEHVSAQTVQGIRWVRNNTAAFEAADCLGDHFPGFSVQYLARFCHG